MGKLEFLQKLSERLAEELPRSVVLSNLKYYESYIDGEVAKGRSVSAVMEELGDPYMIARTIIDGLESDGFTNQNYADETVYAETVETDAQSGHREKKQPEKTYYTENGPVYEKAETYEETNSGSKTVAYGKHGCLITAVIVTLIVILVAVAVGKVVKFLWPVLAPVLLIFLILSIVSDNKKE